MILLTQGNTNDLPINKQTASRKLSNRFQAVKFLRLKGRWWSLMEGDGSHKVRAGAGAGARA